MSLFIRINRLINVAPQHLDKRQHAEYFGIFLSCLCGAFSNVVLVIIFAIESVHVMTLFSITGIFFWSLAAYFARIGRFSRAVYIGLFEMMMHVAVASFFIGTAYGIHLVLWAAIAFATLNATQKSKMTILFGLLIVAELTLLSIFSPVRTDVRPYEGYENVFFAAMILMAAVPFIFVLLRLKAMQIKQRKKLQKQIYKDELTQLYNRNFLYELLEYELDMIKKSRSPFCLCFADVDYFKKVNDTHGHHVGDEVLVGIADVLRKSLRKSDVICRWGGEEFVVVLPRCSIEIAPLVIEKIRQSLSQTSLSSKELVITMSFGIVTLNSSEPLDAVFKRADELLYLAKANGRDRIEVESSP